MKQFTPFVVPPHSTHDLMVSLDVYQPGPFENRFKLYVDDGKLRELILRVRGNAKPKPKELPTAKRNET